MSPASARAGSWRSSPRRRGRAARGSWSGAAGRQAARPRTGRGRRRCARACAGDHGAVARRLGAQAADLAQIVPELHDRGDVPPADPDGARVRLFDATAELLRQVAAERPTVLVLDDLHAADQPSLLLLRFLARELGPMGLLVVGAYRDVAPVPGPALVDLLAELTREPVTRRMVLGGLSEREIARVRRADRDRRARRRARRRTARDDRRQPAVRGRARAAAGGRAGGHARARVPRSRRACAMSSAAGSATSPPACLRVARLACVLGREFPRRRPGAHARRGRGGAARRARRGGRRTDPHRGAGRPWPPALRAHPHPRHARRRAGRGAAPAAPRARGDGARAAPRRAARPAPRRAGPPCRRCTRRARRACATHRAAADVGARSARLRRGGAAAASWASKRSSCACRSTRRPAATCCWRPAMRWRRRATRRRRRPTFLARLRRRAQPPGCPSCLARAALGYGGSCHWQRAGDDRRLVPLLEEALAAVGQHGLPPARAAARAHGRRAARHAVARAARGAERRGGRDRTPPRRRRHAGLRARGAVHGGLGPRHRGAGADRRRGERPRPRLGRGRPRARRPHAAEHHRLDDARAGRHGRARRRVRLARGAAQAAHPPVAGRDGERRLGALPGGARRPPSG